METRDLTDAPWERMRPLLPPPKPHSGRPAKDHRTVINGIPWAAARQPLALPSRALPPEANEAPDPTFDRSAYRERNVVERLINRLKQWRRIATRYEERAANYRALLTIAAILLWL